MSGSPKDLTGHPCGICGDANPKGAGGTSAHKDTLRLQTVYKRKHQSSKPLGDEGTLRKQNVYKRKRNVNEMI